MADGPITPSREDCEEAREMGRVAGGSLSEEIEASRFSIRLQSLGTSSNPHRPHQIPIGHNGSEEPIEEISLRDIPS